MENNEKHYLPVCMDSEDVEWNPKEDGKKRHIWREEEVLVLLRLMKKHSLINKSLSHSQLAEVLVKPLRNMGFNRTAYQIRLKLKNMRKSYLQCKRNNCSPASLKECPHYGILATIYENDSNNAFSDSDNETNESHEKSNVWSEREIKKMLSIVDELNLAHELSLTSFSLGALRLVSKGMRCSGFDRHAEHIKNALLSLKTSYIECKKNIQQGTVIKYCPYYKYLEKIWGSDEIPDNIKSNNEESNKIKIFQDGDRSKNEFWSEEETIVLLTSIKELNITDEAFRSTDYAINKIYEVLTDSGYARSNLQIKNKLENLKENFLNEKHSNNIENTIRRFPFYHRYESLFGSYFTRFNTDTLLQCEGEDGMDHDALSGNDSMEKKKHNRSPAWSEEETILVLALIQELNLMQDFKERMTLDIVSKLVAPLAEHGFRRTAGQIKIKLKNLRTSYQKCQQAGCTSQALAECPFYNRLHAIFQKPAYPKKLETVRRLEPIDHSYVNASEISLDHSYISTQNKDRSLETYRKPKFISKPEKDDVWFPVETVADENTMELSLDHPACEESQRNVEYEDDDQDSDVSHVTGFEEVDEKEIYVRNEVHVSPKEELSDRDDNSPMEFEKKSEEASHLPTFFLNKNRRDILNDLKDLGNEGPSSSISQTRSSLKRKHSKVSSEKLIDASNHRTPSESPFNRLLDRKEQSNVSNDTKSNQDPTYINSMRLIMSDVLKHEKWMQQQHHMWMERQFEIQRKHDRDQRELLLNELRELRRTITSSMLRREFFGDH